MQRFLDPTELCANTGDIYKKFPLVLDGCNLTQQQQREYIANFDIKKALNEYGAIMFRNFAFREGIDSVLKTIDSNFSNFNIGGQNNRTATSERTATSSAAPDFFYIPQHNEWGYNGLLPDKLAFYCSVPPKTGGATIIANNRNVTAELPQSVTEKLNRNQQIYTFCRQRHAKLFKSSFISSSKKRFFNANSDEEVDHYMEKLGFYNDPNNSSQICSTYPAFAKHPNTKEKVLLTPLDYFNDYVFANGAINCIKFDKVNKSKKLQHALILFAGYLLNRIGLDILPQEVKLNKDNITRQEYREYQKILNHNKVYFKWEKNDLLIIDNLLVTHGKQPHTGNRKITVSMGTLLNRQQLSKGV